MFGNQAVKVICLTFLLAGAALVLMLMVAGPGEAKTLTVDDDGGADHASIQDAIDNATEGDTVFVHAGIYREQVVVNKSISIIGNNRNNTVINGSGKTAVEITADNVTLECMTIEGSMGADTYPLLRGIYVTGNYCAIKNCRIINNLRGIGFVDSELNKLQNCLVEYNQMVGISFINTEVAIHKKRGNIIQNSIIQVNVHGFYLSDASNVSIDNCTIRENEKDGIYSINGRKNTIKNCIIQNNGENGIEFTTENNTLVTNCTIIGNGGYGIYQDLGKTQDNSFMDNEIQDNRKGNIKTVRYESSSYVYFSDEELFRALGIVAAVIFISIVVYFVVKKD
ncbi:MAG: right-handed parallel beta-helix repeat-containing protein [Thermoplasmata archaeon]|nr:right-handed parallel beta-helix repeat-containing protein [Thermoplasmata archaeon]